MTKENEMSEASVREFVLTASATEITNRIEQQAKELAECQARVVELGELLNTTLPMLYKLNPPTLTAVCIGLSEQIEALNLYELIEKTLASTDTAAQTLRGKP